MSIEEIMFFGVGTIATGVALHKMKATVTNRHQLSKKAWVFAILICVMSYISIDRVELFLSNLIAPNIAWLLRYWLTIFAFYTSISVGYFLNKRAEPRWIWALVLTTVGVTGAVYLASIRALPNYIDQSNAETFSVLVFMCSAYICLDILAVINTIQFGRLALKETDQVTAIRWFAPTISAGCGVAFFTINFVYFISEYIGIVSPLESVTSLIRVLFVLAMCLWPIFFLPRAVISFCLIPFNRIGKIVTLIRLNRIQHNLNEISTRIALSEKSRISQMNSLDLQIYRAIIAILDSKRVIEHYLQLEVDKDYIFLDNQKILLTKNIQMKAQRLHELLNPIDDNQDFDQLVFVYSRIGRRL